MTDYLAKYLLKGKNAVVTGGAGLIGKEIVTALAQAGARVLIADIDKKAGMALAEDLGKQKLRAEFYEIDITDLAGLEARIKKIAEQLGYIDVWVNNAYPRTSDWGNKVEDITVKSWQKNVDMQLNAYSICAKYAAELMKPRGGSIINMGSIYGVVGPDFSVYGDTNMTMPMAYAVIKGGIINLSRYLASYFGKFNVRVNTVCPGGVISGQDPAFVKKYSDKTPLKRMANKEEIASAVLFLASDASSYVTGSTVMVDGGWTAV